MSHPAWVCGLKLSMDAICSFIIKSHPAWVCGLKLTLRVTLTALVLSHPAWVCGLKPQVDAANCSVAFVTPCVGVWIETCIFGKRSSHPKSHPAWVCGLKLSLDPLVIISAMSHPAWVCGLKLLLWLVRSLLLRHTLRGCVD